MEVVLYVLEIVVGLEVVVHVILEVALVVVVFLSAHPAFTLNT